MAVNRKWVAQFQKLRESAKSVAQMSTADKNKFLNDLADRIDANQQLLMIANRADVEKVKGKVASAFIDRLILNEERIKQMTKSLRQVAREPDPVGEVLEDKVLSNQLHLKKVRAPLGVIFMIFESRPNVVTEAFALAFKSGNAIAMRGGSESKRSVSVIYRWIQEEFKSLKMKSPGLLAIDDYDRKLVAELLERKDLIDVTVPRGGEGLITLVTKGAKMPVIKNDRGLCHAYVDDEVDLDMAIRVVHNAKTSRPGVCNSLETLLVHKNIAALFLPQIYAKCESSELKWRCDGLAKKLLPRTKYVTAARAQDWNTEHLEQIINCKVVTSLDAALAHIENHGSKHSEVILTSNEIKARKFQNEVDAAAVYWNASTRFTDGFEFGLGGELGISTQKLHVRGPVGLKELTTPRWIIDGSGQIRE